MKYDYTVNTGYSYSPFGYNLEGGEIFIGASFARPSAADLVPGFNTFTNIPHSLMPSVNGVTLLETTPSVVTVGFSEVLVNSGDVYTSGFTLRYPDKPSGSYSLLYDARPTGAATFQFLTGSNTLDKAISGLGTLAGKDVYLNGIKLYTGESYTVVPAWIDSEVSATGVLAAINSRENSRVVYSSDADVITSFNKSATALYLNGVRETSSSFLESASVVTGIVKAGIVPQIYDTEYEREINFILNNE
jgi:hypothetical protein